MPVLTELLMTARHTWPEAAIAVAGIALVGGVVAVVVWQLLATWRARIAVGHDEAYRGLAERLARELQQLNARLREGARERGTQGRSDADDEVP